jgi:hypothetical protein
MFVYRRSAATAAALMAMFRCFSSSNNNSSSSPILVQPTDTTRTQCTKCRMCSTSWGWASTARNMYRPLILNKLNKKCITLVCCLCSCSSSFSIVHYSSERRAWRWRFETPEHVVTVIDINKTWVVLDGILCNTCVYHIHSTAGWIPSTLSAVRRQEPALRSRPCVILRCFVNFSWKCRPSSSTSLAHRGVQTLVQNGWCWMIVKKGILKYFLWR